MSVPTRSEKFLKTGHAPGHLRDCLLSALENDADWWQSLEMDFMRERHQRWWNVASPERRAYWLIGQLWHCTDIVPGSERASAADWLHCDEEPFTFAQLVRALKADLDSRAGEFSIATNTEMLRHPE